MAEELPEEITKEDIRAPKLEAGGTAIVLQRHEKYQRDRSAQDSGSLFEADAAAAKERDIKFFRDVLASDSPDAPTYVLFASSDTQYNKLGYRSMETAQLAEDACQEVMTYMGINPQERVINLSGKFATKSFKDTGQEVRPVKKLREPDIFGTPDYISYLRQKYGAEDGPGTGISKAAWAAHEADTEKAKREEFGAEGPAEILKRTKKSVESFARYAEMFHRSHPESKLIIWVASHYDTISPFVKDAEGIDQADYVPVDYGGGIVLEIAARGEATYKTKNRQTAVQLGKKALLV